MLGHLGPGDARFALAELDQLKPSGSSMTPQEALQEKLHLSERQAGRAHCVRKHCLSHSFECVEQREHSWYGNFRATGRRDDLREALSFSSRAEPQLVQSSFQSEHASVITGRARKRIMASLPEASAVVVQVFPLKLR